MSRGIRWLGLRVLCGALAFGSASCGDDGLELFVDLKTDLVPDVEFVDVQVLLLGEGAFVETPALGGFPFDEGQRVAEFDGLGANPTRGVRVVLLDAERRTVAEREIVVQHTASRSVTLLVTRDCRDVTCPEGDTCYGGRCVDPGCVTGNEPECPEPECERNLDCPNMDACAIARCESSVCVYVSGGLCAPTEYCDPGLGCTALPDPVDAGPRDAGADAPSALPAPQPFAPPNGHPTGSVHAPAADVRQLTLRWEPVAGAAMYDVEITDECDPGSYRTCPFASPSFGGAISAPLYITAELPVSTTPPVGTRYYWRVRACRVFGEADTCAGWSDVRYVDVGRLTYDVNGDGYDDLLAGGRYAVVEYLGGPGGLGGPRVLANPVPDSTSGYGRTVRFDDFNADGYRDALVGAPFDRGFGAVMLHLGGPTGLGAATVRQNPPASELNDFFGDELCSGDFDGDGYADVAVGSLSGTWWYRGGTAVETTARLVEMRGFGGGCADANGDGYQDLLGGRVALGGPGGPVPSAGTVGNNVLGDLDGDGRVEMSGTGDTNSRLYTLDGSMDATDLGFTGAGMGTVDHQVGAVLDMDGDGSGDAILAWPGPSGDSQGDVWRVPFSGLTPQPAVVLNPCTGACRQGWAISAGADYNGDGFGDAAVSYHVAEGVSVYLGRSGAAPTEVRLTNPGGFTDFGTAL